MHSILVLAFILLGLLAVFCILAFYNIHLAHQEQFKRADYPKESNHSSLTYADFSEKYPRETIYIPAGKNILTGFLYGTQNTKGLIIISSGHRMNTESSLRNMKYFVDHGWMVMTYDYTGYYNSEGKTMLDYVQAVRDLDTVLSYIEKEERFKAIPLLLFGHSLGAYVSTAVLIFHHRILGVVSASGFDKPTEQWAYSVKRFSGKLGGILAPLAALYLRVVYGKDTVRFSAVSGINAVDIPVLAISGTTDVFYGGKTAVYNKKDKITNPNCKFILMEREGHNGHYEYMMTDRAVEYQKYCHDNNVKTTDKWLAMEQDDSFFDRIDAFFSAAVEREES